MQNNKKNKIDLPANHKRAFSSTLYLIEKMLVEIETILAATPKETMVEIERNISIEEKEFLLKQIEKIRKEIQQLNERYKLNKQQVNEKNFVNSRITKIWELLHDSGVKRMNAYGRFPELYKANYEEDILKLLKLVDKLKSS